MALNNICLKKIKYFRGHMKYARKTLKFKVKIRILQRRRGLVGKTVALAAEGRKFKSSVW